MIELPVPDVLAAARAAGLVRVVTVGTTLSSSRWSANCAQQHPDVYAAVALHPNDNEAATLPSPPPPPPPAPPPLSPVPPPSAPPPPPAGARPAAAEVLAEIEALPREPRVVAV